MSKNPKKDKLKKDKIRYDIDLLKEYRRVRKNLLQKTRRIEKRTGKRPKIPTIPKNITQKSVERLIKKSEQVSYTYNKNKGKSSFNKKKGKSSNKKQSKPSTPRENFYSSEGEGSGFNSSNDIISEANKTLEEFLSEATQYMDYSFEEWSKIFGKPFSPNNPYDVEFLDFKRGQAEDLQFIIENVIPIDLISAAKYIQENAQQLREFFDQTIFDSNSTRSESAKYSFQQILSSRPLTEEEAAKNSSPEDFNDYDNMYSINDVELEDFDY